MLHDKCIRTKGNQLKKTLFSNSGFSLIELIVVITIGAIMSVIAVPKVSKMIADMRLRSAIVKLSDSVYLAKGRALANPNIHCGLYVHTSSLPHKVIIFFDDNANNFYDDGDDRIYQTAYTFEKDIKVATTGTTIVNDVLIFRGDGSAKNGGTIQLQNANDRSININVLASTGRVRVIK